MTHWVKVLGGITALAMLLVVGCNQPNTRPDRPANAPYEEGPTKTGKADGFDWGSGCEGGEGTFTQEIAKDAVVTVGTIPKGQVNVEIKLTSDEDVDIQLIDEDGTKVVQWPDGLLNEAEEESIEYKGVRITYSGYNGDGSNLGHEFIKIEGATTTDLTMKAYGYAAGEARIDYKWDAKPDCVDSGSGSFTQEIPHDGVVDVGTIPKGKKDIKISLVSTVDIDIQLFDGDTKVVHWSEGLLKGPTKVTKTYRGVTITWSGYNGDGTGKGNEYIEIAGKTECDFLMKVYGYEAGTATVHYSWGGGQPQGDVEAKVIFSPRSKSSSHVAEVVKLINGAQHSVDIAMYSMSDSRVNNALKEAIEPPRNVKVRFIFHQAQDDRHSPDGTKSAKLEELGVDVRYATKSKVMHHKYMIVDGPRQDDQGQVDLNKAKTAWLVTGSANWSGGAQTIYDENTTFIKGASELVLGFQKEFNRLWNYSHDFVWKTFDYRPAATLDPSTFPNDPDVDALFTSVNFKKNLSFTVIKGSYKVAEAIVKEMNTAQQSIYIASGHFRSWPIYDALVKLKQSKPHLDIKVYLDGQEYISKWYNDQEDAELQTCLAAAGSDQAKQLECRLGGNYYSYKTHKESIPLKFKYYCYRWSYQYAAQMHNKYLIIDKNKLITGSYNASDNAERNTLENMVVLRGSTYKPLIQKYVADFDQLWKTDEDGSLLASLKHKVQNDSTIPLVFKAMALTWDQITELKSLIRANCSLIDSEDYRKHPENHKTCPRN